MMFKDKPKPVNYNSYVVISLLIFITMIHMGMVYKTSYNEIQRIDFDSIVSSRQSLSGCDKWIVSDNETDHIPIDWCVVYMCKGSLYNKRITYLNTNDRNEAYIYAIQNGAKWIFDTSSSYSLKEANILNKITDYKLDEPTLWRSKNRYINPLPSLGCINCYPPYFPLSKVKDTTTFKEDKNDIKIKIPLHDSLVFHSATSSKDELYTYLINDKLTFPEEIEITIALPISSYTMIVTHSTVYHKDVFPALYMFKSIIVRSYFIQEYLNHLNKHVMLFSPFVTGSTTYKSIYNDLTVYGLPNILCNLDAEKSKYYKVEKLAICFLEEGIITIEEFKEFQEWLYMIYII